MNALVLTLVCFFILITAYFTYGSWLEKFFGIDSTVLTPAYTKEDGRDYVPSNRWVILGHHFASIAGASTLIGPIQASVFGWLPVVIWIVLGGIFLGGVLDYGALVASVKHQGKTLGGFIEVYGGKRGKILFNLFAWFTMLLVTASFIDIVSQTFQDTPSAGTTSILFIIISVLFGAFTYKKKINLFLASIVGIFGIGISVYLGGKFPLFLTETQWVLFLGIYAFIAAVLPVWLLLQPRDYLNSYLLYSLVILSILGLIFLAPNIQLKAYEGFSVPINEQKWTLFPMVFATVTSGAISGYHILVASGISSKQVRSEEDTKIIGYGGMLLESLLAIIAVVSVLSLTGDHLLNSLSAEGPIAVFSQGIGPIIATLGIDPKTSVGVISLIVSGFALTSLDTGSRLGRYLLQELVDTEKKEKKILVTYCTTLVTISLGCIFSFLGYERLWILMGITNQFLAILGFLCLAVWMKKTRRNYILFLIPMIVLYIITIATLGIQWYHMWVVMDLLSLVLLTILFFLSLFMAYIGNNVIRRGKDYY